MVADRWIRQVEKILRAMEITSDATKVTLANFQLEGESQLWWDWVRNSRNVETLTWEEFKELFMGNYFPATARRAKAKEFLELRQGTMSVLEYVAKFTELARFADDYVASDAAKVQKFEDGLKLSIRGKISALLLQDLDMMVKTAMEVERELEDARNIRETGDKGKKKEGQSSSSGAGKRQRTSVPQGYQGQGRGYQGQGQG